MRMKTTKQQEIEIGDLYYTSWGYDQTNYEYIIIEEISKTGKTVKARRTHHKDVGYSDQCYKQQPIAEPFGDQFRLYVRRYSDGDVTLVGQYPFCYDASMDNTRMGYFWPVKGGKIFYETDTMFGH